MASAVQFEKPKPAKDVSRSAPRLLTPKEAADLLGVPEGTLAQWRSQRRGPSYIKLEGRLVRYRASDLENYLSRHAVETELDHHNSSRYGRRPSEVTP
jgi:excisionase family DNA binding protein